MAAGESVLMELTVCSVLEYSHRAFAVSVKGERSASLRRIRLTVLYGQAELAW